MITEQDLQEAIAECEGLRNPTSSTCVKLAAYYVIQERMFGKPNTSEPSYSFAANSLKEQVDEVVEYVSDTEFSRVIRGRYAEDVWPVIDELMSVLQATNPRLYDGTMRKLES